MTERYKVFPATEHRKHSNRFEVWDTELQQCKGQYVGRSTAQGAADILNGVKTLEVSSLTAPLQLANWDARKKGL